MGVETGVYSREELDEYLATLVESVNNLPYSAIGQKRIFEHLEQCVAKVGDNDSSEPGFYMLPGKYTSWTRMYFDDTLLGLAESPQMDREKSVTEEAVVWAERGVIDNDVVRGTEIQHNIFGYHKGDVEAKVLWETHYWTLEGSGHLSVPTLTDDGRVTATFEFTGRPADRTFAATEDRTEQIDIKLYDM